jgi:hypothetical protein
VSALEATPRDGAVCCPYCRQDLDEVLRCDACSTGYHPDCARALGRCALLGCAGAFPGAESAPGRPAAAAKAPRRWRLRRRRVVALAGLGLVAGAVALFPNLQEMRRNGNETAAIGALKSFATAQALFRECDKEQDGVCDYGTLDELIAAGLVSEDFADQVHFGYVFTVQPSQSTPEFLWAAKASPVEPGVTGTRHFMTNHEGVTAFREGEAFLLTDDCQFPDGVLRGCGCAPPGVPH